CRRLPDHAESHSGLPASIAASRVRSAGVRPDRNTARGSEFSSESLLEQRVGQRAEADGPKSGAGRGCEGSPFVSGGKGCRFKSCRSYLWCKDLRQSTELKTG